MPSPDTYTSGEVAHLLKERQQLYRLIEGHCDQRLGVKSARSAIEMAANLRARAQQIHDGKTVDQLSMEDANGNR